MKHKQTRAVLLLATMISTLCLYSCKDDDEPEVRDTPPRNLGITYNVADSYFTPKKLNMCASDTAIYVDWYANEKIGTATSRDLIFDRRMEYAEHYSFADGTTVAKCREAGFGCDEDGDFVIRQEFLLSPYKEYAAFYGDTLGKHTHNYYIINLCVLPVTSIDVVCDKNFDQDHPAGTSLNDIVYLWNMVDFYGALHNELDTKIRTVDGEWNIPLNTLPDNPLQLMQTSFFMKFISKPSTPGTYEFTVKFTFGADPLTGETVDVAPATVSIEF